jgi:hypothetical protein
MRYLFGKSAGIGSFPQIRVRALSGDAVPLLVNAGRVEVVIVTNENSTIDPTYDVNDASDGP